MLAIFLGFNILRSFLSTKYNRVRLFFCNIIEQTGLDTHKYHFNCIFQFYVWTCLRLFILFIWFQGLIPRAKLLLTLGGTFFLAFWPLIVITVSFFFALYFVRLSSLVFVTEFQFNIQQRSEIWAFLQNPKWKTNNSSLIFLLWIMMQFFGPSFVHDGSETPISPPPYVDPYALLEDERISQISPRVNWLPYNP